MGIEIDWERSEIFFFNNEKSIFFSSKHEYVYVFPKKIVMFWV